MYHDGILNFILEKIMKRTVGERATTLGGDTMISGGNIINQDTIISRNLYIFATNFINHGHLRASGNILIKANSVKNFNIIEALGSIKIEAIEVINDRIVLPIVRGEEELLLADQIEIDHLGAVRNASLEDTEVGCIGAVDNA